tara:strand:+ start:403 stop:750 length:348 start_codon:yes stop_codon:yes gene_type:complete
MATQLKWDTTLATWEGTHPALSVGTIKTANIPFTWSDIQLVNELMGGGGTIEDDMPWMKPEKKSKLIKLILKIKGKTLTESKQIPIKQYKIKAEDVRLVIKEINGIELTTENVSF